VGAFPVWRPNLDELDVDSAPVSAFLILKSFKIIPLQLGCRVPARVLACLLSDGPEEVGDSIEMELGIPRGAAGSSSNELTVRGCPIAGDLCNAPSLTRVKFLELGAAEISSKPKPPLRGPDHGTPARP
jgi:hypothetical protein